ncbi:S-layer homology domain-containing protein [Bacillus sp. Gen3]|nr:S-layer homology domain-containing protein [Bacillus sp. Gen3]
MAKKSRKVFATTATAALVASAVAPIASSAAGFSDVTKPEYKTAIDALAEAGILNGYENGTFKPENKVTRGEVAKVITLIRHLEEGTKTPFKDVKDGYWSTPYINSLYAAKLVNGYENGTFKPEGNVTRAEFAKLVVDAYGLTLTNAATPFTDVKAGNWATPYIQTAYANGLIKGVTASKFDPSAPIKRGDLAILLHRADSKFGDVIGNNFPGVESVKAVNTTTVEVTFKEAVKDVAASNFSIEGLTVSNASVKQTDSKTVVLTTSTQEGGKQYTVKSGTKTLGKFTGVSAVVPKAVKVTTPSVQGTIGKEVTLKAEVTVEEGQSKAGIPVTFNIVSDNSNLNSKIEVEAYTDANGVASYSYTRYYKHNDNVVAYATNKSDVSSNGKVYWAEALSLTEVTQGNTLANGSKKVYKIKTDSYQVAKDSAGKELYKYVNVAFAENVDVTPDKLVRGVKVIDTGLSTNKDYPSQVTTGGVNEVRVKVNDNGEATFTLTGSNASVTPIVFVDTDKNDKLSATELQAKAPTVKFDLSHTLGLDVKAEGSQNAASISTENKGKGGREYTVTVTDKDGKVAPKGTVAYVTFQKDSLSKDKNVYVDNVLAEVGKTYAIKVTNDKGQASFVLTGQKDAYATPTVFLNNGTSKEVALDDNDLQKVGEITYFVNAVVENATLTITDKNGNEVTSVVNGDPATFTYQSVDQNGFDYYTGTGSYEVTFQVTAQFGDVTVTTEGGSVLGTVKKGTTETFKVNAKNGTAKIKVNSDVDSTISVEASASQVSLPNVSKSVSVVTPAITVFSGKVIAHDATKTSIYVQDANGKVEKFNYSGADFYDNTNGSSVNTPLTDKQFTDLLTANAEVTYKKVGDKNQFYVVKLGNGTALPTAPPVAPGSSVASKVTTPFVAATPEKFAEITSTDISKANFSSFTFTVSDGTNTATVSVDGVDDANTISNKINTALKGASIKAEASVKDNRVTIKGEANVNLTVTSPNSHVFDTTTSNYAAATPATAAVIEYNFTTSSVTDLVAGNKVVVNGITYTAGNSTIGTTFDASGSLDQDLANLAAVISVTDTKVTAAATTVSAEELLTLTERTGKEGTALTTAIAIQK